MTSRFQDQKATTLSFCGILTLTRGSRTWCRGPNRVTFLSRAGNSKYATAILVFQPEQKSNFEDFKSNFIEAFNVQEELFVNQLK